MTSPALVARTLWQRRRLRGRERWTRGQVHAHQLRAAEALREYATARSPFYRRFHRGLERAPLDMLPPLTKATLMDAFDEAVTDRSLRLADLQTYLADPGAGERFGRYWVAATSGAGGPGAAGRHHPGRLSRKAIPHRRPASGSRGHGAASPN